VAVNRVTSQPCLPPAFPPGAPARSQKREQIVYQHNIIDIIARIGECDPYFPDDREASMGKQNFLREKVQVQYTVKLKLTDNDRSLQDFEPDAGKLIKIIEKEDWSVDAKLKKKRDSYEIDRIMSIGYPQVRNGHVGESGHDWQWQLDTESMGSGSRDRLYLDDVSASVTRERENGTIKVGRDDFVVIDCEVTIKGKFTAGTKH
jgi:hypothetical protein